MFAKFGIWEIVLILVIILIVFGVGKLPQVGKSLGSAISEFKNSVMGKGDKPADAEAEEKEAESK